MNQPTLFNQATEAVVEHGKVKCPCCDTVFKVVLPSKEYDLSLDDRLITQLWDIALWLKEHGGRTFNPREVFGQYSGDKLDYQRKVADCVKLQYWDLIEGTGKSGWWRMTYRGRDFLMGRIQVDKIAVVKNSVRVRYKGEPVIVNTPDERWQKQKSDWATNYNLSFS